MLRILFSLCFVIGNQEKTKENIVMGDLLDIYTDIKKENLKISFEIEGHHMEALDLSPITRKCILYKPMIEYDVYTIRIPNSLYGKIIFEIYNNETKILKISSFYQRDNSGTNNYVVSLFKTEETNGRKNIEATEANYTYIRDISVDRLACVVSADLEKKVELDKRLEFVQIRNMSDIIQTCESLLRTTFLNVSYLSNIPDYADQHKLNMNNFMYALLYNVVCLHSYISFYFNLYNGPLYESCIMTEKNCDAIKMKILRKVNDFFNIDGHFNFKMRSNARKNDFRSDRGQNSFEKFEVQLLKLEESLTQIRKYITKQNDIEERYLDVRNLKYFVYNKLRNNKQNYKFTKIVKNKLFFASIFWVRHNLKIYEFVDQYMNNLLNNEMIEDKIKFFEKIFDEYIEESENHIRIYINRACLFYDQPEEYYENLIKDNIFNSLTPEIIYEMKNELEKRVDSWQEIYKKYDYHFGELLKYQKRGILKITKLWKDTFEETPDIFLFKTEANENPKVEKKVYTTKDNDWSTKTLMVSFLIILTLVIIYIIYNKIRFH